MFKKIRDKDQDMFEAHVDDLVKKDHPYRKLLIESFVCGLKLTRLY